MSVGQDPIRTDAQWAPFMEVLRTRLIRERRRRRLRRTAEVLLVAALAAALWFRPAGGPAEELLLAEVPRSDSPLFQPDAGGAVSLGAGRVLIVDGGGS